MREVTVRELRNYGGKVLDSVERGENLVVTRHGKPVAELRALGGVGLTGQALLARWKGVPVIGGDNLRADLRRVIEAGL